MVNFVNCNIDPQNANPRSDNQLCVHLLLQEYLKIRKISSLEKQINV